MGHMTHEESVKSATFWIIVLAIMTICEVVFALLGKGFIIEGFHLPELVIAGVMIVMSLIKAYLIVYEFMHMKYEVPGMVKSVLLPTLLLVWAVIAFFWEGADWNKRRTLIENKNKQTIQQVITPTPTGELTKEIEQ